MRYKVIDKTSPKTWSNGVRSPCKTYISQRNKSGIFTLQHSWKGLTRACLESPLPANLTSLQTTLRVCISKYCNIKKRSVLIWWTAWYLPKVIFTIQMIVMDGNWRHCCKKNAQRIPILSSEVSHKLNFFFPHPEFWHGHGHIQFPRPKLWKNH